MLDLLERGIGGAAVRRGGNRTYAASDAMRERSERRAVRILSEARRNLGQNLGSEASDKFKGKV